MRNTNTIKLLIILIILLFVFELLKLTSNNNVANKINTNFHDGTYVINGEKITLKNDISEKEISSSSATKIVTRYFGNEIKHDFDGDGREDSAFLITQETGGSGIFYYIVARLNTINGFIGSQGLFLGDRIAPQTTEMGKGNVIIVNFAERNPKENFSIQPSVGKSIWLILDTKTIQFGEVSQNFEGEADLSRMTLDMKTWNWKKTTYNNDKEVTPRVNSKFTITFKNNGTFAATTDCNNVGGEYSVNGTKFSFDKMMSTMMYCENSQDLDFNIMLSEVQSYIFTSKGELILNLNLDSGSMIFN